MLLLIPSILGLRDIPASIPVHRLIWRSWYHTSPGPASNEDPGESPKLAAVDKTGVLRPSATA